MKGLRYEQSTGTLAVRNGPWRCPVLSGYAGAPGYVNDPDAQCLRNRGPLPRANYTMRVVPHHRFAAPAIALSPQDGSDLCGRSGFFIHGDNSKGNRSASEGCPIFPRREREWIASMIEMGYTTLEVVP